MIGKQIEKVIEEGKRKGIRFLFVALPLLELNLKGLMRLWKKELGLVMAL